MPHDTTFKLNHAFKHNQLPRNHTLEGVMWGEYRSFDAALLPKQYKCQDTRVNHTKFNWMGSNGFDYIHDVIIPNQVMLTASSALIYATENNAMGVLQALLSSSKKRQNHLLGDHFMAHIPVLKTVRDAGQSTQIAEFSCRICHGFLPSKSVSLRITMARYLEVLQYYGVDALYPRSSQNRLALLMASDNDGDDVLDALRDLGDFCGQDHDLLGLRQTLISETLALAMAAYRDMNNQPRSTPMFRVQEKKWLERLLQLQAEVVADVPEQLPDKLRTCFDYLRQAQNLGVICDVYQPMIGMLQKAVTQGQAMGPMIVSISDSSANTIDWAILMCDARGDRQSFLHALASYSQADQDVVFARCLDGVSPEKLWYAGGNSPLDAAYKAGQVAYFDAILSRLTIAQRYAARELYPFDHASAMRRHAQRNIRRLFDRHAAVYQAIAQEVLKHKAVMVSQLKQLHKHSDEDFSLHAFYEALNVQIGSLQGEVDRAAWNDLAASLAQEVMAPLKSARESAAWWGAWVKNHRSAASPPFKEASMLALLVFLGLTWILIAAGCTDLSAYLILWSIVLITYAVFSLVYGAVAAVDYGISCIQNRHQRLEAIATRVALDEPVPYRMNGSNRFTLFGLSDDQEDGMRHGDQSWIRPPAGELGQDSPQACAPPLPQYSQVEAQSGVGV